MFISPHCNKTISFTEKKIPLKKQTFISFHCNRKITLIYKEENSTKKQMVIGFHCNEKNHFCEKENSIPKTNILAHFLLIYSLIAPQIFSSFMEIKSDPKLFKLQTEDHRHFHVELALLQRDSDQKTAQLALKCVFWQNSEGRMG